MTVHPCEVGLFCPFEHFGDGGWVCTYPDIKPKRHKLYPLITKMDDCELYPTPISPLEQLIEGYEKIEPRQRVYRDVKVTVEIRGDDE